MKGRNINYKNTLHFYFFFFFVFVLQRSRHHKEIHHYTLSKVNFSRVKNKTRKISIENEKELHVEVTRKRKNFVLYPEKKIRILETRIHSQYTDITTHTHTLTHKYIHTPVKIRNEK